MAQTISVSQKESAQRVRVGQKSTVQKLSFSPNVDFLRGEPGFSPTIDVRETDGGFDIAISDKDGVKDFFLPSGNAVTPEQVQEAVSAYLTENPIEIEVADTVSDGDMRPVSSNAVYMEMSNITALMRTI